MSVFIVLHLHALQVESNPPMYKRKSGKLICVREGVIVIFFFYITILRVDAVVFESHPQPGIITIYIILFLLVL